ncbi:MAG: hypothetical protein ACI9OJ_000822 [Myxococcota bacterium]|jgi:hypothetical protein
MTPRLTPTIVDGAGWTFLRLTGTLGAASMPAELRSRTLGTLLFVDLSTVGRVEPAGILEWTGWLASVSDGREIVLVNCSAAVVAEMGQFDSFASNASVMSVAAPYYCETCDADRPSALILKSLGSPPSAPDQRCKVCGEKTTFDDIEATWFGFLPSVTATVPNAHIEHALICARFELGEGPPPAAPKPAIGAVTERVEQLLPEFVETPQAGHWDTGFWLAVGVLLAVLTLVILQLASQG